MPQKAWPHRGVGRLQGCARNQGGDLCETLGCLHGFKTGGHQPQSPLLAPFRVFQKVLACSAQGRHGNPVV